MNGNNGWAGVGRFKKNGFALSLLVALGLWLGTPGCATRQPMTPAQWQTIAQTAAYAGASIYLDKHPGEWPKFALAKQALDLALANGRFDAKSLHDALESLGPKTFQGDTGIIIVDAAVILVTTLQGGSAPLDQAPVAQAVMEGIAYGIGRALQ